MTKAAKFAIDTKVPVSQTRNEIEAVLAKFGASAFAFASYATHASVMFEAQGRRVRFDLPLDRADNEAKTARLHRERWRALFLAIKAKLVSVDTGIETFEEAFMAHIVMPNGQTVAEGVLPQIADQYASGRMGPLMLPGPSA